MEYTVDYFIGKFSSIPDELWTECYCEWYDKKCAMGHCGTSDFGSMTEESLALYDLLKTLSVTYANNKMISGERVRIAFRTIYSFNDGHIKEYQQPTAKERILAALYDVKKMQEAEKPKEIIRYVAVSEKIEEKSKELILN